MFVGVGGVRWFYHCKGSSRALLGFARVHLTSRCFMGSMSGSMGAS